MNKSFIKVSAPATISNVGCGFDVMGFATNIISDEVTIALSNRKGLSIKKISGDGNKLPYNVETNTCTKAILSVLKSLKLNLGLEVTISKKIGFGSGLGSSAASAVAGAFAINELLGRPFTKYELLNFAIEGERIASQATHADNVAPCLFGGFILIRSYNPIDLIELEPPKNLFCTVIHPQIEIKTSEARKILGRTIPLKAGVAQWGNVGALVAGILSKDINLIGRSVQDEVAEPKRAALIPRYYEIKNAALESGANGCNISGSGPAIFAFSKNENTAWQIGKAMKKVIEKEKIKSKIYVSRINKNGPRVIG
ncbi:MAG: homoserine kinase [Ignavibacteriaceae bacterium]|nr:homoserine kinase [Ignavibacteriaceae bacterium]